MAENPLLTKKEREDIRKSISVLCGRCAWAGRALKRYEKHVRYLERIMEGRDEVAD